MAGGYGNIDGKFSNIQTQFVRNILKKVYPPLPILNIISKQDLAFIKKHLFDSARNKVLNVGSGNHAGVGYRLWIGENTKNVLNFDIEKGLNVDVVGDAHSLPFEENIFDSIIMQAVIEHLHTPTVAISEAFRVLKHGGHLYLEVPFLQGFHGDPHDYQRYTINGLKKLIEKYGDVILVGVSSGPFSFLVWWIRDFVSNLTKVKKLNLVIRFIISWLIFPMKYLDLLFRKTDSTERLACEYFILIRAKK